MKPRRKRRTPHEMTGYDVVNKLAADPDTAKDAVILWLMLELHEALTTLNAVREALR